MKFYVSRYYSNQSKNYIEVVESSDVCTFFRQNLRKFLLSRATKIHIDHEYNKYSWCVLKEIKQIQFFFDNTFAYNMPL